MGRTGVVGTTIWVKAVIWDAIRGCGALHLGREVRVVRMGWGCAAWKRREEL